MDKQYLDKSTETTTEEQVVKQSGGVSNSEQQEKLQKAKYLANYEQALGGAIGSKLYETVSDLLTMDQMVRYGKDLADSLLDAAVKAASEKSGANLTGDAQEQVVGGLEALLDPIVERMIRSETGQKLVQKLQHGIGSNPYAVAGAGILAAAVAVLTDADIPTLQQSVKLGGGFSANGSVDLGSLRNIALGASKIGISYKREDVRAGISISRAEDGKLGGEVSGRIGDDKQYLQGKIGLSEEGITAFEIGGALGLGNNTNLSGKATGTELDKIPDWNVQVSTENGDFKHTGDLRYSSGSKDLFAKYTGQKESLVYYASLSGNVKSESLNQFKAGARYTPDKGDVYSADYQYNFANQSHQLDMVAQERMGDFSLRGHQQFKYNEQDQLKSNTELMAAYHMGTDLSLIGGADIKHDFQTGQTVMAPKAGIQYKDVPIVLSYDPQTKSTSVGITLKF
jgi:hypothetical protein